MRISPQVILLALLDKNNWMLCHVTVFFPSCLWQFHVVMFNLPLVSPPLSEAANEAEAYDMPFIARSLAEVMDEVGRCVFASETL